VSIFLSFSTSFSYILSRINCLLPRPHISGLAALILGSEGNLSPAALKARILSLSSSGVISGVVNGTSNLLGSTINGL